MGAWLQEINSNSLINRQHCFHLCSVYSVIYEPKAPDNEEKSAVMFQEFAKEANLQVTHSVPFLPVVVQIYEFDVISLTM